MSLYAELPGYRARQILLDVAVLAWILVWIRIGMWVDEAVNRLAGPGRAVQEAGMSFARPLHEARREVADIPVVGEALERPLAAAADAGRLLADAGAGQQDVVHTLAVTLGVLFAVIPVSLLLALYLPGRVRWVGQASTARRLRAADAGLELFALRAVATRPLRDLYRVTSDPAHALRSGDHAPLAALELRALGLTPERASARRGP